jgi:outer membrane immunogenic protein
MKDRVAVAFLAISFTAGGAFAADVPLAAPQFYGAGRLMSVEWTGLYFGVNAGYGWAPASSNIGFVGDFPGGTTTPFGGPTELSGTRVIGSGNASGAIAGGQMGFNWQAGMVVFGAEVDAQWSGQQKTVSATCLDDCVATQTMKINSIVTGRGRVGLAFDWLMPYVTAGAALVNAQNDLTVTVGGVTANFPGLSSTTLGWSAGVGLEAALWGKWSAKLEYLHIGVNGLNSTARIPGVLGVGTAFESGDRGDNIVRVGLNYRFGPRGGPGVLETPLSPSPYAVNYDFLPSAGVFADAGAFADKAKPARQPATPALVVTADAAPEASSIAIQPRPAKSGTVEDAEAIAIELPPLNSSKKRQAKEEDESQRLKRVMTICSGC